MRCPFMVDAAQQAADDGGAGAGDAGDQRGALPETDRNGVQNGQAGQRPMALLAQPLTEQQQQPVDHQEGRSDHRRAEQAADELLQQEAEDHCRDGGDDDQQEHPAAFPDLVFGADAQQARRQRPPITPEIPQQRRGGAEMQHHQERQESGRPLIEARTDQRGQHDGMAQAGDGEQLGGALDDGDEDGLQRGHVRFLAKADRFRNLLLRCNTNRSSGAPHSGLHQAPSLAPKR